MAEYDTYSTFKVWCDEPLHGRFTHIEIDGEDVSGHFQEVSIHASIKGPVTVVIDPIVEESTDAGQPLRLLLGTDRTRELLIKHGWTPPQEAL